MNDADRATSVRQKKREKYFNFLDKRIPELHAEGKPAPSKSDPILISKNLTASRYPGVKARHQADREWGEMQAAGR